MPVFEAYLLEVVLYGRLLQGGLCNHSASLDWAAWTPWCRDRCLASIRTTESSQSCYGCEQLRCLRPVLL